MAPGTQGQYEHLDPDEARLPEGMQRVGYDADTQTYTFRDSDGSLWESEEGNRYGTLHRAGQAPQPRFLQEETGISKSTRNTDIRYLAPFFVLVCVVLLLLYRYLASIGAEPIVSCAEGLERYRVSNGDTCWDIAKSRRMEVDDLIAANGGLDCDRLLPGKEICVSVIDWL